MTMLARDDSTVHLGTHETKERIHFHDAIVSVHHSYMRISALIVTAILAIACAHPTTHASNAPPIGTVDLAVAPERIARALFVDLHAAAALVPVDLPIS